MVHFDGKKAGEEIVKEFVLKSFADALESVGCQLLFLNAETGEIKFKVPPIAEKIHLEITLDN